MASALDKVFDADTRAVLKRCILVEVTAQCVKDSVREKRKFGSDKALHGGEFEGLVQRPAIRNTGACLLRAQTRHKPDRTRTDRCKPPALAHCTLACRAREAALPKDAQLGDALQYNPLSCSSMLYILYVLYGPQPTEPPLSTGPCYMCYMCYMGLTRQAAEPPLSPGPMLYVLYVLYGSYNLQHVPNMHCIAHIVHFKARAE